MITLTQQDLSLKLIIGSQKSCLLNEDNLITTIFNLDKKSFKYLASAMRLPNIFKTDGRVDIIKKQLSKKIVCIYKLLWI